MSNSLTDWIPDTLNARLLQALPDMRNDIAWRNFKFNPSNDSCWIQPLNIPTNEGIATLGNNGHNQLTGFYQIGVFAPLNTGVVETNRILTALRLAFPVRVYFDAPPDCTFKTVSNGYSTGGQVTLSDAGEGGIQGNWDASFFTVYWLAREPRNS